MSEAREMNKSAEMICIVCPMGCRLKAEYAEGGVRVTGNTCQKGMSYAAEELTNPTRMVTTSIPVAGGHMALLSVKTAKPVPKAAIPAVLKELHRAAASAPIKVGDVVIANTAGTGVDVVATRSVHIAGK